jgi:hypothetical protein
MRSPSAQRKVETSSTAHGRREFFRLVTKMSSGDPQLASWGRLYKKVIKVLFNKRAGVFLDLIKHATCEFIKRLQTRLQIQ